MRGSTHTRVVLLRLSARRLLGAQRSAPLTVHVSTATVSVATRWGPLVWWRAGALVLLCVREYVVRVDMHVGGLLIQSVACRKFMLCMRE